MDVPVGVLTKVTAALDGLGVPYVVGGSVASSFYGDPRSTNDIDIIADLHMRHAAPFTEALGDEFYADESMAEEAIQRGASFNVIHIETAFKVDVFICGRDPLRRRELERRTVGRFFGAEFSVSTAEDIILAKLDWYRLGQGVSDQQWRDVLGVLRMQGDALDFDYLTATAETMGLADLLARAREDAGV